MKPVILPILLCVSSFLHAQQLFMSRDVKAAYEKSTRSMDGKPGKNYWQNGASYNISITAMPPDRTIKGEETIRYSNNSSDTLSALAIKLFLNVHKPGAPREFPAGKDYLTEGVQVDEVTINGVKTEWNSEGFYTSERLPLQQPLLPKQKVELGFKWHYQISKQSGREGMIDSTTFFLAYFYPRVAVYDDYNGWDINDFVDSREFYSDFNDYDVMLKVPANYVVWGTGTLQHPEKLLQSAILERYSRSLVSDAVVNIVTKADLDNKNITQQNAVNEWHFTCSHIPDVTFGISDHYVWDGTSVVVDDATGRRASAQAAYKNESQDYHRVSAYAQHSLGWLSHHWPGIAYPYEKTTVFQGFADMEYPMMANNSSFPDTVFSRFVAEHEIAHTYMPFYMGINETRYGFMDEGWATAFEYFIGNADLGKEKADSVFKRFRVNNWIKSKSSSQLVPIITPSDILTARSFGSNIYGKAALGYLALKEMLGDDLFKKCLHEYMNRWNGKHPIPWDFFNTFNNVSGKDLNWFWNQWYFQPSYIDIAIQSVKPQANKYNIVLKNIGGMPAPVTIVLHYKDGTTDSFHQTPLVWQKDQLTATVMVAARKNVQYISLDGGIFMDADASNDTWKGK